MRPGFGREPFGTFRNSVPGLSVRNGNGTAVTQARGGETIYVRSTKLAILARSHRTRHHIATYRSPWRAEWAGSWPALCSWQLRCPPREARPRGPRSADANCLSFTCGRTGRAGGVGRVRAPSSLVLMHHPPPWRPPPLRRRLPPSPPLRPHPRARWRIQALIMLGL